MSVNNGKLAALILVTLILLSGGIGQIEAATLWYSGDSDRISAINQNNAQFDQVIYSGFIVTGSGWNIASVWSNDTFTLGPPASTTAEWEIRSNMPTGSLVASGDAAATLTPTGFIYSERAEEQLLVTGLNVDLGPGTYWLAVYPDNTSGGHADIEHSSGDNAIGTSPGPMYFSTDGGSTFQLSFDVTSAGIGGVALNSPEPSSVILAALGALCLSVAALRRRS